MDYEVIWSGTLDRQGLAPHATGYIGRSSLFICDTRAPKETLPARLNEADRNDASRHAYQKRYSQTAEGKAKRKKADRDWRARVKAARERNRVNCAVHNAKRRAAQQNLFGTAS